MNIKAHAQSANILLFGILVPLMLLFQAYSSLASLRTDVTGALGQKTPAQQFSEVRANLSSSNDFALYSMMSAEHVNQTVVVNKQVMKIAVMQIGFAVVSVGLMFVILGINDGGGSATGSGAGLNFDFKTGSTGALVFVIGAAMATAGGVLKNDYQTVSVPMFNDNGTGDAAFHARLDAAYTECGKLGEPLARECFYKIFPQISGKGQ